MNMASDVELHCWQCTRCQKSKIPAPTRVLLTSMPIGKPWQMVAVDILKVPVSYNGNMYLLVVQDYLWANDIPLLKEQTAATFAKVLVDVLSKFGLQDIVHSDQGIKFESTLLKQILDAFSIQKTRTTAYHLKSP